MRSSLATVDESGGTANENSALVSGQDTARTVDSSMSGDSDAPPLVHEVIDKMGVGWAQWKIVILAGGTWAADGAEILIVGSVTKSVSDEWDLSASQRGMVVSTVFIGVMIGNYLSGMMGDQWGRKYPLLFGYFGVFAFSCLSAGTQEIYGMLACRACLGIAYGIGVPANVTLISEVVPTVWRAAFQGFSQSLFGFGEFYGAGLLYLDDPAMTHLHWRRLLLLGSIPSLLFGLGCYFFLKESPLWLSAHGRTQDTRDVLASMRSANHADGVSVAVRTSILPRYDLGISEQQSIIFKEYKWVTLLTCVLCFTMNVSLFGLLYAFPQVLPHLNLHFSAAENLMFGAVIEIPGYCLAGIGGQYLSRKTFFVTAFTSCSISLILFIYGDGYFTGVRDTHLVFMGYLGCKFWAAVQFVAVYMYATEVFPTPIRNSGTGICASAGRLGAIASPLLYENLTKHVNNHAFFFFVAALGIMASILTLFGLTTDNSGKRLTSRMSGVAYSTMGKTQDV